MATLGTDKSDCSKPLSDCPKPLPKPLSDCQKPLPNPEIKLDECPKPPTIPKPPIIPKEYMQKYELIKLNAKQVLGYPWPAIIVAVLGLAFLIYALFATNINSSTRWFSVIMIILWTLMWTIILWVLWNDNRNDLSWYILLIPVVLLIIFFILVVIMNVDGF